LERPFKTPFVPLVPILGIVSAFYLIASLPRITWIVVGVWLVIGLAIYFTYSTRHSRVQALAAGETQTTAR
jgi:APA family basic amino acid/polyamine antiporter